jgi:hypothetical protein
VRDSDTLTLQRMNGPNQSESDLTLSGACRRPGTKEHRQRGRLPTWSSASEPLRYALGSLETGLPWSLATTPMFMVDPWPRECTVR